MAKYIIEIEDWPVNGLYKAKNFRTLVFDEEGLKKLERVKDETHPSYYYISDQLKVCMAVDDDNEEAMMRKETGNYFYSEETAKQVKNRILELLGRETYEKAALTREGMLKFLNGGYQHDAI